MEIRESHANRNSRENIDNNGNINKSHLIKKSVIKDMERQLKYRPRLHPEGSTSTYLLIKKLELEKYNPVILYKLQGEKYLIVPQKYKATDEKSELSAIGIETKAQHEMFVKHSAKITCTDATHGTNQYVFPLISLVIPDDFGKGCTVGHSISNRSSEEVLTPFLEAIKEKCTKNFEINALMADDDNSGWNAFKNVFPSVNIKHLLCKWDIVRAW